MLEEATAVTRGDDRVPSLEGRAMFDQECLLVSDLLDAFMGLPTEYLELVHATGPTGGRHIVYCLSRFHGQFCDASLCEQVQRCAAAAAAAAPPLLPVSCFGSIPALLCAGRRIRLELSVSATLWFVAMHSGLDAQH